MDPDQPAHPQMHYVGFVMTGLILLSVFLFVLKIAEM
jgi:hypothetical protein